MTKRIFATILAAAFGGALFGVALPPRIASMAAEGEQTVLLTDADGKEVEAAVSYNAMTGKYELASHVRNIYAVDLTGRSYNSLNPANDPVSADSPTDFSDGILVSAYVNTLNAYDFYTAANIGEDFFGVNGRNNQTAGDANNRGEYFIYVYAHDASAGDNAFFALFTGSFAPGRANEGHMRVGDGSPTGRLYRQARARDIIAHEYQHGVTSHFLTGTEDGGETGSLKEAFSDVFGCLAEGHDPSEEAFWTIGEDGVPAGEAPLRNLKNPAPYAADMAHKYTGADTEYGKYCNSTIISHLNFRIYSRIPDIFTRPVMGRLWFAMLKNLQGKSRATFADFTQAFRAAAAGLPEEEGVLSAAGKTALLAAVDESLYEAGLYTPEDAFAVTFEDGEGNVLATRLVPAGGTATPPAAPEKPSDGDAHYTFAGWVGNYSNVERNETVLAAYTREAHTFGDWTAIPATCEGNGERHAACTACGYEAHEVLPAAGHSWGAWSQVTAPTYTQAGKKTHTCTVCGKTEEGEIPPLGLVAKFRDEVAALSQTPAEELFEALKGAYATYTSLSAAEKTAAADAYETYLGLVRAYNEETEGLNSAFDTAYHAGVYAFSTAATALGVALLAVIRRWGR